MFSRKQTVFYISIIIIVTAALVIMSENGIFSVRDEETNLSNAFYFKNYTMKCEVLSCELIEDDEIDDVTIYPDEYFHTGEKPTSDYLVEHIDYIGIQNECDRIREILSLDDSWNYSEELDELFRENQDIVDKYTTYTHPETRYYFIKCRITNLLTKRNEAGVYFRIFTPFSINTPINEEILISNECSIYFDKPTHTIGNDRIHNFYLYEFEGEEVLECTLGFALSEGEYTDIYGDCYVGVTEEGVDIRTLSNTPNIVKLFPGDYVSD